MLEENPSGFEFIRTQINKGYKKDDPPLIDLKVTNPISYLKKWFKRVLGNEGITFSFRIRPLTAILMSLAIATLVTGTSLSLPKFLPSYFIADEVVLVGNLYKKADSYLLLTSNSTGYTIKPNKGIDLTLYLNNQVIIKGNLVKKSSTLEASEVYIK